MRRLASPAPERAVPLHVTLEPGQGFPMRTIGLVVLATLSIAPTAAQDVADVVDPFAGEWSAFRPGGEERTLVVCAAPVTMTATGGNTLTYRTYAGLPVDLTVSAEGDRLVWRTTEGTQEATWVDDNEFVVHPLVNGAPDLANVLVYHRCPLLPRRSYDGAPDGNAAAFAGLWRLETPYPTGNKRNEVAVECGAPIAIAAIGDTEIAHRAPGGEPVTAAVTAHEGHTDWRFEGAAMPWEVVWIDPTRFHVNTLGIDGVTEWRSPMIYVRCE